MMNRYCCLDHVHYDQLNFTKKVKQKEPNTPRPLCILCYNCITECGEALTVEAVTTLPTHLAIPLLKFAIGEPGQSMRRAAITAILANWPLDLLCLRDVLTDDDDDIFQDELGFDLVVFRGITSRSDKCCIRRLDLRGCTLNWTFTKLIIQMWPILSMKKSQRNVKRLTDIVVKRAGLKHQCRLAAEIIPQLIKELLNHEMITHPQFGINLGRGEKMVVHLDRLEFRHQNTFFMDYLITNCLRDITPLTIVANNIIINSELNVGDSFADSLAPFIIFKGHDVDTLEGLCWENLEDSVFFATSSSIQVFSKLTSLALLNCNICLQEGRTRRRTAARTQINNLLASLPHLRRLDLSQNSFAGCLAELLESCCQPLDFLALNDSDLANSDMDALVASQHAVSLKELNLSRICGLFPNDDFAVKTSKLIQSLKHFPQLMVLWICQNQIRDHHVDSLNAVLQNSLLQLRALHLAHNLFSWEAAFNILLACMKVMPLQFIHITINRSLLNQLLNDPADYGNQVKEILRTAKRTDLYVKMTTN